MTGGDLTLYHGILGSNLDRFITELVAFLYCLLDRSLLTNTIVVEISKTPNTRALIQLVKYS